MAAASEAQLLGMKIVLGIIVLLGSFLGGEYRAEEAAFPAALTRAREAVSTQLEDKSFRALEAEAERNDRAPPNVVVHLSTVIVDLQARIDACEGE